MRKKKKTVRRRRLPNPRYEFCMYIEGLEGVQGRCRSSQGDCGERYEEEGYEDLLDGVIRKKQDLHKKTLSVNGFVSIHQV